MMALIFSTDARWQAQTTGLITLYDKKETVTTINFDTQDQRMVIGKN